MVAGLCCSADPIEVLALVETELLSNAKALSDAYHHNEEHTCERPRGGADTDAFIGQPCGTSSSEDWVEPDGNRRWRPRLQVGRAVQGSSEAEQAQCDTSR